MLLYCNSFIQAISIAPLQVHYYLKALSIARRLCRSFTPKRRRQLRVKDLPKVPTWRLERDSKTRSFGRKASNLPMSHNASHRSSEYQSILTVFCQKQLASLCALRTLRSHGLQLHAPHEVAKMTRVASILYASPAWWEG